MTYAEQQAAVAVQRAQLAVQEAFLACLQAECDGDAVVECVEEARRTLEYLARIVRGEV